MLNTAANPYRTICMSLVASALGAQMACAEDWQYSITPYLWAPSLDLSLGVGPNAPVSAGKSLLEVLDGALLVQGEARRGRWSFLGEFNYLNLSDDFGRAPGDARAGWRMQGTMIAFAAGYAVHDERDTRVEVIGGLRAWDLETSTTVADRRVSKDSKFIDPMLGLRVETPLGQRASLQGLATLGGSNFGSDRQVEAIAQVTWPLRGATDISAGYRYLSLDFDDDTALIDATMRGPFVSVTFNF